METIRYYSYRKGAFCVAEVDMEFKREIRRKYDSLSIDNEIKTICPTFRDYLVMVLQFNY